MHKQLKLEELAMFALGVMLYSFLDYAWWVFPLFILLPDVSMAGYLINNKTGAIIYNIFHHKGLAILLYIIGLQWNVALLQLTGLVLFSHSCLDRMLGYGLKYPDSFSHTHLGWIGNDHKEKATVK